MFNFGRWARCICLCMLMSATAAKAEWNVSVAPLPNAFAQSGNMTLELQCDRIRFAPAGYEDTQDIVRKHGLSLRFMKDGKTEVSAFQVGATNAKISIVDNFPVEIRFSDASDYSFILDQIARNAILNISMIDRDVTYGLFTLKGSAAAVRLLRSACAAEHSSSSRGEAPEGVVYCGGKGIRRVIEYAIVKPDEQWDAVVTVNGNTIRAMTAYSYFNNSPKPKGFLFALLGEDKSEYLVFRDGTRNWIESGDYTYEQCN